MILLKVAPLTQTMDPAEIEDLAEALAELDIQLPEQTEDLDLDMEIEVDPDAFGELAEILEENQAYADIYIPGEFSDIYELSDERRVGSLDGLLETLEEIAGEMGIPIPDEDEDVYDYDEMDDMLDDEDDDDREVDVAFRTVWEELYRTAKEASESSSNLIIVQE